MNNHEYKTTVRVALVALALLLAYSGWCAIANAGQTEQQAMDDLFQRVCAEKGVGCGE